MDILYQLPFPDVVCSKIFVYACKSPHTGLGVSILKNKLQTIHLDIPEKDEDVIMFDLDYYSHCLPIDIYLFTCFHNLTKMYLCEVCVTGDIEDLKSLRNLTEIDLGGTGVTGDIAHLKSLSKLTDIKLYSTGVTGDIVNLNSLLNLTEIRLWETGVTGNIENLKSLPKLTEIYINDTGVTGNKKAFTNYRKSARLPYCIIYI